MEIKKFQLHNTGCFSELEVPLAPTEDKHSNITVIVGNNGAGKTTLLKSLATALSWLVARIKTEKGSGSPIAEDVIKNTYSSASIDLVISDKKDTNSLIQWTIAKTRTGRKAERNSKLDGATALADDYREMLSNNEQASLPMVAFYPVERSVIEVPLRIRKQHTFEQLDGYDDALSRGVDFKRFFEWFREREDTENESGISDEVFEQLQRVLGEHNDFWKQLAEAKASSRDRQLTAVRTAISIFMPDFENLRIRRKPRLHMSIDKQGERLNVAQLSQGEKSLLALIGDIARRLAMMNPQLENPLQGDGVVLIDEVDLHLHPKWQRSLVQRLQQTFPNCQFILTTHSPLLISDSDNILCYLLDDGELSVMDDLFGLDANQVLLQVMDTDIRNSTVQENLDTFDEAIQDKKLQLAQGLFLKLKKVFPQGHIELAKASLMLKRLELRLEKNN